MARHRKNAKTLRKQGPQNSKRAPHSSGNRRFVRDDRDKPDDPRFSDGSVEEPMDTAGRRSREEEKSCGASFCEWKLKSEKTKWWRLVCCLTCGLFWILMELIECCCSPEKPGGIPNIGATCYANSIFQVLGQTPGFRKCLNQNRSKNTDRRMVAVKRTLSLLDDLSIKLEVDSRKVSDLLHYVMDKDPSFSLGHQNDCHSFLLALFDILKDEMGRDSLRLVEGHQCNQFSYSTCEHKEKSEEQMFNSLLIPIEVERPSWSVEDGLRSIFGTERFDKNIIPCRICQNSNSPEDLSGNVTTKRTLLKELPRILVLHIARFKEVPVRDNSELKTLEKIRKNVQYNEFIDMSKFCDGPTAMYRLYAVISHKGTLNGGHYYATVRKLKTDSWFYCSDTSIRFITDHDYKDANAYLLLYERQME